MPGYELIDSLKKALTDIFKQVLFFAHGFDKKREYHVVENLCEKYFNVKYCLMVSSGTYNKIGLKSLGVKNGDDNTQSFNFIATIGNFRYRRNTQDHLN